MPVAVVALAAYSFVGAAAAATAVGATMATMVAAGAVMVGSALTVVGTLTGNQKLTKIGGIIGLAGGIGGLANSALSGAETAGSAAADTAGTAATDTATDAAADAATSTATSTATDAATDAATSAVTTSPVTPPGGIEPMAGGGAIDANSAVVNPITPPTSAPTPAVTATPTQPPAGAIDAMSTSIPNTFDATATKAGQAAAGADPFNVNASNVTGPDAFKTLGTPQPLGNVAADPGMLSQMQAWAKANPELAKIAAGTVQGMATNLVPSAKDKAMMDLYKQQSDLAKRKQLWGSGRTV